MAEKGGTLQIGLKWNRTAALRDVTLQADHTMPELSGLKQSGGSHVTVNIPGRLDAVA